MISSTILVVRTCHPQKIKWNFVEQLLQKDGARRNRQGGARLHRLWRLLGHGRLPSRSLPSYRPDRRFPSRRSPHDHLSGKDAI